MGVGVFGVAQEKACAALFAGLVAGETISLDFHAVMHCGRKLRYQFA